MHRGSSGADVKSREALLAEARQCLGFGEHQRAIALLNQVLARWPEDAQALAWLHRMNPQDADLAFRTGVAAGRAGRFDIAAKAFAQALATRPQWAQAQVRHGDCLLRIGALEAAHEAYSAALRIDPSRLDALYGLRDSLPFDAQAQRAQFMQRICELSPTAEHFTRLASDHYNAGELEACHAALDAALALDPDYSPARWQKMQWPRWFTPPSQEEAQRFIRQWRDGLSVFEQRAAQAASDEHLHSCPAFAGAFHRHYLPDADVDQPRYGKLLRALVTPRHPDAPSPPKRHGKKRIAIVTSHLHFHTVSRLFVPLLANIDSTRFDVHVLSIGAVLPQWRDALQHAQIHDAPRPPLAWGALLRQLQPDLVLYPEIGLEISTQWLACQRFAPVQVALWGHPVTTGLSSIDAFISNDAMEPSDAQRFYTERLVRLPGFGHGFVPDERHARHLARPCVRTDGSVDILCTQSAFKLLPEQDELFARVLQGVPNARLHLLPHPNPKVREHLLERMAPALQKHGADPARIVVHPLMPFEDWLALAANCAFHLDSLGFSGGMTSFDLCAIGLPAITLPGQIMRSRQTGTMMQAMDLPELVATNPDDYVAKAIALAHDLPRCQALAHLIRERSNRLWNGGDVVEALNRFLIEATSD